MIFVNRTPLGVGPVDQHAADPHLAAIKCVLNDVRRFGVFTAKEEVPVTKPLPRLSGLQRLGSLPAVEGLNGHGLWHEVTLPPVAVARGRNG